MKHGESISWPAKLDLPVIEEIQRQAEAALEGTIQFGTAADQKALTLAGIFGGSAFALLAIAAAVLGAGHGAGVLLWAAFAAGSFLLAATLACGWAGRPGDFYAGGYEPRLLALGATDDAAWMRRCIVDEIQKGIDFNRACLERSARRTVAALWLGALAIPAGLAAGLGAWWAHLPSA